MKVAVNETAQLKGLKQARSRKKKVNSADFMSILLENTKNLSKKEKKLEKKLPEDLKSNIQSRNTTETEKKIPFLNSENRYHHQQISKKNNLSSIKVSKENSISVEAVSEDLNQNIQKQEKRPELKKTTQTDNLKTEKETESQPVELFQQSIVSQLNHRERKINKSEKDPVKYISVDKTLSQTTENIPRETRSHTKTASSSEIVQNHLHTQKKEKPPEIDTDIKKDHSTLKITEENKIKSLHKPDNRPVQKDLKSSQPFEREISQTATEDNFKKIPTVNHQEKHNKPDTIKETLATKGIGHLKEKSEKNHFIRNQTEQEKIPPFSIQDRNSKNEQGTLFSQGIDKKTTQIPKKETIKVTTPSKEPLHNGNESKKIETAGFEPVKDKVDPDLAKTKPERDLRNTATESKNTKKVTIVSQIKEKISSEKEETKTQKNGTEILDRLEDNIQIITNHRESRSVEQNRKNEVQLNREIFFTVEDTGESKQTFNNNNFSGNEGKNSFSHSYASENLADNEIQNFNKHFTMNIKLEDLNMNVKLNRNFLNMTVIFHSQTTASLEQLKTQIGDILKESGFEQFNLKLKTKDKKTYLENKRSGENYYGRSEINVRV
ncbi:hypothetical protein [Persephonella sp.]